MVKCKSGLHEWIDEKDAQKCCNGFRRVLVIGSVGIAPEGCDKIVSNLLPGGVIYGYKWVKEDRIAEEI